MKNNIQQSCLLNNERSIIYLGIQLTLIIV